MSTIFARVLTMISVVFQSIFNLEPDATQQHTGSVSRSFSASDNVYHLAGLVLARGGSKGIPRKNLAEINGHPLLGRALDTMIESGVFSSIWVSTDDPDISKWVQNHYPKETVFIHDRAGYTATDSATSISAVLEFIVVHPEVDAVGLIQATSPFQQSQFLQQAAHLLFRKEEPIFESVFSASCTHHLRWSVATFKVPTSPLNFNPNKRPRRQDWSGEMVENGMFYFAFRHVLVNYRVFQSKKSAYVEIPKHLSLEVDTQEDLEIARCLALRFDKEKGSQGGHADVNQKEL